MQDETIKCGCGKDFEFTVGEQKFYQERGYQKPKRCPDCRKLKKQQNNRGDQRDTGLEPIKV